MEAEVVVLMLIVKGFNFVFNVSVIAYVVDVHLRSLHFSPSNAFAR